MSEQKPHRVIRQARAEVARATGHAYRALELACEDMPRAALEDLVRLIRNLQGKARREKAKRRKGQFWG